MAVVWENSFDGDPGDWVTIANSGQHGDPIAGLRNNPPPASVRYGDEAALGAASLRLGLDDASAHGDVWLYYPTVNAYSTSWYLYLPTGGWMRLRDSNAIIEVFLATESASWLVDTQVPQAVMDSIFDNWVRVETIVSSTTLAARVYWTDIHAPATEEDADYVVSIGRGGGTVDGIFAQGGTGQNAYIDQVRIGEGEWLGPWPPQDEGLRWENGFNGAVGDEVTVELRGVDVFDPTTGEVRSSDTGQVALWMIDTDYNEESFFVRRCYFTGGQDPYKRLKTALKADIDEDAWASLYATTSEPFPRPSTGKIAVKVINHYGDEVLKVYDVRDARPA